ncbi:peptide/nickel transport system substrate-binding protein [Rhizobiales bacterium GAS188]|nr:peptide/nickel transport system substrate-binding protein [Rhizobiales bacterium GAS188]
MSPIRSNTPAQPRIFGLADRRAVVFGAGSATALAAFGVSAGANADISASGRAIAMHGQPVLPEDFTHFPYADPQARRGGRLVWGVQGTFDSLNPLIVKGNATEAVMRFAMQSLMTRSLDEPFSMYGLLARRIELSPDRTQLTFHLAENACFADKRPVTADDVVFSFDLLKSFGKPLFRAVAAEIRAVSVRDAKTVSFTLAGSTNREVPLSLALWPIFPRHATDMAGFANTTLKPQLGSGPYLVAEVRPGSSIILRRNPNFWAADLPQLRGLYNVDELRYEFYRDANSLFEAFKTGLVDLRVESDPARWVGGYDFPAAREGRIVKETIPIRVPAGMNGFAFNSRRDVFADARLRQALTLLFDFRWVNANLFFGAYRRTAGYFDDSELSSVGRPASDREIALLAPYGEEIPKAVLDGSWRPPVSDGSGRDRLIEQQALQLLEAAGWSARSGKVIFEKTASPLEFEIMTTSQFQERLALNYASSLARIGVTARVRRVDEVQFWRRMQHFDFDMVQYNWEGTASPGSELPNRWSSAAAGREGSLNYPAIRSKAVDACIEAVLSSVGLEEYVDAIRALDRALIAGSYVVPLFHAADIWLARAASVKRPAYVPLRGFSLETVWRSP